MRAIWTRFGKTSILCILFIPLLSICVVKQQSLAANSTEYIPITLTGCFSSLTYNEESTDLGGHEIIVMHTAKGYYVYYMESMGEPADPQLLPAKVVNNSIEFALPALSSAEEAPFQGHITADGLSGTFTKTGEQLFLKRKKGYWDYISANTTIVGCYSNREYNSKADNAFAYQLYIVPGRKYFALYHELSSIQGIPQLLTVEEKDHQIRFTVLDNDKKLKQFSGAVTTEGLHGRFNGAGDSILLTRQSCSWSD